METVLIAPQKQSMSADAPITPVQNDDMSLCCPSALSCCLGMICPCTFLTCLQVDYKQEVVQLIWGKYQGTIREPGLYCSNGYGVERTLMSTAVQSLNVPTTKVVDARGNPLVVAGVVTFQILDTRKAALDVVGWHSFLSTQAEVVLKQICSVHPYEAKEAGEDSLKREADKVRVEIVRLLQSRVDVAGIQVRNFEFKELSYAPEIASQMLVRQQAEAMLEARTTVVEGSVRIAWDAVCHLRAAGLVFPDSEASRLAANLVVTICSESRVQPTIQLQA